MIVVVFFSCSPSKMLVKFWDRLPSCRSAYWGMPAEGVIGFLGPLPFTRKRCEVYPGFVYRGPEKDVCVSPAYCLVSVLSSCVCTLFLPQAYFAFSEELPLRRAHVVRETGKAGRVWSVHRMPASYLYCNHEEKHSKYTGTGFISCIGQEGEGIPKLS